MDRELKGIVKTLKNNNRAKYKTLQNEFDEYKRKNDVKVSAIFDLREENKRLREALEFYGNKRTWENGVIFTVEGDTLVDAPPFIYDAGEIARQALENKS